MGCSFYESDDAPRRCPARCRRPGPHPSSAVRPSAPPPLARSAGSTGRPGRRYEAAVLGFRDYWYPVTWSRKVGREADPGHASSARRSCSSARPASSGRSTTAAPTAASRSSHPMATQEFPGTWTCCYHGWTFDLATGTLVAAITDGPDSPICGKVAVRTYPVEERLGLVWLYVGDGDPPPVETDIPAELLDADAVVLRRGSRPARQLALRRRERLRRGPREVPPPQRRSGRSSGPDAGLDADHMEPSDGRLDHPGRTTRSTSRPTSRASGRWPPTSRSWRNAGAAAATVVDPAAVHPAGRSTRPGPTSSGGCRSTRTTTSTSSSADDRTGACVASRSASGSTTGSGSAGCSTAMFNDEDRAHGRRHGRARRSASTGRTSSITEWRKLCEADARGRPQAVPDDRPAWSRLQAIAEARPAPAATGPGADTTAPVPAVRTARRVGATEESVVRDATRLRRRGQLPITHRIRKIITRT